MGERKAVFSKGAYTPGTNVPNIPHFKDERMAQAYANEKHRKDARERREQELAFLRRQMEEGLYR